MADELKLPEHVKAIAGMDGAAPTWYKNEKTGKWIHRDNIAAFCAAYWKYRDKGTIVEAKIAQQRNLKAAGRRWNYD